MLSYPHKINRRIPTNVCYGSFTGSKTLKTYIFKTVHWQFGDSPSTDSAMSPASTSTANMSVCLSVCKYVSLSITMAYCPWPVTYIRYVTALA